MASTAGRDPFGRNAASTPRDRGHRRSPDGRCLSRSASERIACRSLGTPIPEHGRGVGRAALAANSGRRIGQQAAATVQSAARSHPGCVARHTNQRQVMSRRQTAESARVMTPVSMPPRPSRPVPGLSCARRQIRVELPLVASLIRFQCSTEGNPSGMPPGPTTSQQSVSARWRRMMSGGS